MAPGLIVVLSGTGRDRPGRRARPARGHRHARAGPVHGRAGAALRPPFAGRCRGARAGRGAGRPLAAAARPDGAGGRARRAHHARADPAPRRAAGERHDRPDHHRARRQRATCCGCRASSPATASRTACSTPTAIPVRQTLIERFHVDPHHLPIVLCPERQAAAQSRARTSWRAASAWCGRSIRDKLYDVAIVGAGPAGLAAAVYAGVGRAVGDRARLPRLRRAGRRIGAHRELSRLSDRHFRPGADGARLQPGAEIRRRDGDPGRGAGCSAARTTRPATTTRCDVGDGETVRARARGGGERRALSPARRREPRGVRGIVACTTGPRRSRRGCAAARRWRWSAPAIRPARRPSIWRARSKKVWLLARGAEPGGKHVALSGRPHRGADRTSRC